MRTKTEFLEVPISIFPIRATLCRNSYLSDSYESMTSDINNYFICWLNTTRSYPAWEGSASFVCFDNEIKVAIGCSALNNMCQLENSLNIMYGQIGF
jgi:hypothetical protein